MNRPLKILFIEDLLKDAELIWLELEKNMIPFEKLLVDNKEGVLNGLKSFSPDLIISDYSLPQFDGMTALMLRNEHDPLIPFILVTASINEEIAIDCIKAGADDYIIKGNLSRLAPAIINSIDKSESLKEKKIAEHNLFESEKKLKEAQSIGRIGSWEYDIESNKLSWSDTTFDLYNRNPALGPPDVEEEAAYYSPEQNEKLRNYASLAIKNGTNFEYDLEVRLPGEKVGFFFGKMKPVQNADGKIFKLTGIVQDITQRKLTEQKLEQASSNWYKTFDSIQDAIVLLDIDQQIVMSNKAFVEFTGVQKETLTNRICFGYVHHTNCPINGCPFIQMMKSRKRESMELKIDNKVYRVTVDPIFDNKNNINSAVHIMSDITSLKNTEEALSESESVFKTLVEKMPDGVYKTTHSGKVVDVNPALVKILGYENKEELMGVDIGKDLYFDPEDRVKMTIEGRNSELISYRLRKKNGSEVWVEDHGWFNFDDNGEILYHAGVLRDITERRQSEVKIKKLGKAIEQSPVSIIITDSDGNIEFVNNEFVSRTQYTQAEVFGKKPRIFNAGHLPQKMYDVMWEDLHNGSIWRGEFLNRKKDDSKYLEEVTISSMLAKDNSISNYILIMVDITEKKKTLNELIEARDKAEESDRLKTAFLHNISHEIRTPMNAIVGFSAFLNEPDLDEISRQTYTELITQGSNQLLSIITDIVDIANIEANTIKISEHEVNVISLIRSLCDQFLPMVEKKKLKLSFTSDISESESLVVTDKTRLIQVLTNLLNNALKFTDIGEIKICCTLIGNNLEFCVSDSGIGIPKESQTKIFDRFYQVKNNLSRFYDGTGLGLAISKGYVNLLGGNIWVESDPGKGSSFHFTIPYSKSVSPDKTLPESVNLKKLILKNIKTILVVEDVESNYRLISYYLEGSDLEILKAENGREAVGICLSGVKIDLVLMDLRMPEMDGYEATRLIKESLPALKIIAQTAYADDQARVMENGFNGFIPKPFSKQILLSVIKEFL